MTNEKPITLGAAIKQVLAQVDGPVAVDEFARRVLAIHPSKAKKPDASVRNHLRREELGRTLVYLDRQTILPMRIAMKGVRFRIPVTRQEATQGYCSQNLPSCTSCAGTLPIRMCNCGMPPAAP